MPKYSEASLTPEEPEIPTPTETGGGDWTPGEGAKVPASLRRKLAREVRDHVGNKAGGAAQQSPKTLAYIPPAVTRVTFRRLRAGELVVDPDYNRDIRPRWVDEIAANFNPDQLEALNVSERVFPDGRPHEYCVISGQHRLAATLKARGPDFELDCLVYQGLTRKQEAELFALFDEKKRAHTPYQRFRAHLFAGNPEATEIWRIVTDCGLEVYTGRQVPQKQGVIHAVSTLQDIYRKSGPEFLNRVLSIHYMAWTDNQEGYTSSMIQGTALLMRRFAGYSQWKDESLAQVLSDPAHNPLSIQQRAKGNAHGVSATSLAQEIARLEHRYYNQSRKGYQRLPEWNATPAEITALSEAALARSKFVRQDRRVSEDERRA